MSTPSASVYHVLVVAPDTLDIIDPGTGTIGTWEDAVTLAQAKTSEPGEGYVQILEVTPKGIGVIHRLFCSCGSQYHRGQTYRH